MEQIIPKKLTNLDEELEKAIKQNKKNIKLNYVVDIITIILGISALIMIWTSFNNIMAAKEYDKGWNNGFNAAIEENNLYDRYDSTYKEPETDGEIWETYHDCGMYGLPEYARPYCEKQAQKPNA